MEENEKLEAQIEEGASATAAVSVDQPAVENGLLLEQARRRYEELKLRQNMPLGVLGGIVAGVVCAALWGGITVLTGYRIGYMAIGVGFAVGFMVKTFGKGITPIYGIVAAVIAVLSCVFGNYLSVMGYIAQEFDVNLFALISESGFAGVWEALKIDFSAMDVVFYLLAISSAYKIGFKQETAV